jgi:YD repeat-containing protein
VCDGALRVDLTTPRRESIFDPRAFVEHPQPTVNATTTYDYTPTGELKQIVDAEGNKTTLAYDLRGLRTSFSNPDTGTHQDIFDLMGNRIATITPNLAALGAKIDFVYDRNRLVKIDYPSNRRRRAGCRSSSNRWRVSRVPSPYAAATASWRCSLA